MLAGITQKLKYKQAINRCPKKIDACRHWSHCPLRGGNACRCDRNMFESDRHYENDIISPSKVTGAELENMAKNFIEGFEKGLKDVEENPRTIEEILKDPETQKAMVTARKIIEAHFPGYFDEDAARN